LILRKHDFFQHQDFIFCPQGTLRPRPWSRGLHHCISVLPCMALASRKVKDNRHTVAVTDISGVTELLVLTFLGCFAVRRNVSADDVFPDSVAADHIWVGIQPSQGRFSLLWYSIPCFLLSFVPSLAYTVCCSRVMKLCIYRWPLVVICQVTAH